MLKIVASTLINLARPVFSALSNLGTSVITLDPYFVLNDSTAWLKDFNAGYEAWISYAMLLGFFVNILGSFKKIYKYAFNNAYRTRYVSAICCCGSGDLFFNFLSKNVAINIDQIIAIILISSLILGLYWSVGTTATIKGADKITNNAGFAVRH